MSELNRDTRLALSMALLRAREAVMARFRPLLAAHDLNEQQWRVIRVLAESGPRDATDVARQAAILAPSLTRMIRAMTDRGLITRVSDPADGRRAMLALTLQGETLFQTISPQSAAIYDGITADAGAERVARLLTELNAITTALDPPG
jgi:homoprotocatechuate degradation regulator HpaR